MMNGLDLKIDIILSLNRSLVFNINANMRMICCDWKDREYFKIRAYISNPPTDEDEESLSVILTEFETYLFFSKYEYECVYSIEPMQNIDGLRLIIFARNEVSIFSNWNPDTGKIED